MIEAGGGVIWRTKRGALQVFLIHRPDRDWSVPKGKREPGESWNCLLYTSDAADD